MKYINQFSRIFVGILFIISGLIKLNDPVGTAIKLEEYFEVFSEWSGLFHYLIPFSTTFSILFCISEVVLGIAVLFWYRMRITAWLLFALIVFFTFLTFYSAFFNKVTDCGCFGDAIKLTPWTSFYKDVILLVLSTVILLNRNKLAGKFDNRIGDIIVGGATVVCIWVAWYVMAHLSFIDFRAYKVSADIRENMKSISPDVYITRYEMINTVSKAEKTVTDKEYIETKIWEDTTWQITKTIGPELIKKGIPAKITDYNLKDNDGNDFTQESLTGKKLIITLLFADKADKSNIKAINDLAKSAEQNGIKPMLLTASDYQTIETFRHENQISIPFYYVDATVLKTMIRSNPGILLLQDGVVKGKWHYNDTPDLDKIKALLK